MVFLLICISLESFLVSVETIVLRSTVFVCGVLPLHHTHVFFFLVGGPGLEPGTSAYETDEIAFSTHPAIYFSSI